MSTNIYDYKIDQLLNIRWFGSAIKMKVIGHDEPTNQVRVQHLDAYGSFYLTPEQILVEDRWCNDHLKNQNHDSESN